MGLTALLAVVHAIMWRHDQEQTLVRGKLKITFGGGGGASYAGREIPLRPMELRILAYLALRDPEPVSRDELLYYVWRVPLDPKTGAPNDPGTTVVDVRISSLRKEGLRDHGVPSEIVATVPGGWKLNAALVQQGWVAS